MVKIPLTKTQKEFQRKFQRAYIAETATGFINGIRGAKITPRNVGYTLGAVGLVGTFIACDLNKDNGGNGEKGDQGETRIVNGTTYVRAPNVDTEEFERIVEHFEIMIEDAPPALRTNITKIEVKEPGTPISHSGKTVIVGSDATAGEFVDYVVANNLHVAMFKLQNGKTVTIEYLAAGHEKAKKELNRGIVQNQNGIML